MDAQSSNWNEYTFLRNEPFKADFFDRLAHNSNPTHQMRNQGYEVVLALPSQ
eukprot:m.35595 g.35595  ORF g.35595 m.35595 type:complete len:52 (+) comp6614_c0_seq1:393-548(+)